MLRVHSEALDFIERSARSTSTQALVADFAGVIARQGFHTFIMTGLPQAGHDVEPLVLTNRWPTSWSDRYREQNYFADDPVSRWSISQVRPFTWRAAQHAATNARGAQINDEARQIGLFDGLGFPLRGARTLQSVVSIAASDIIDLGPAEIALLHTAVISFNLRADELGGRLGPRPFRLTKREREVLSWCAAGKSSWEIGEILSISEGTVDIHRQSSIRKLDVVNTTQAVAVAISNGEIQP